VFLLTDRDVDFATLVPTPPDFQLAGDTERVALTAAALGIDLAELDLPVPLDRRAYAESVRLLSDRGLVRAGRLTAYGRDVEAMPVDRPWGELLVHASDDLIPYVAVAANVESLHRITREESDLRGLVVHGSDHLTAYNVFAAAVNECGYVGRVYGLPRHLFTSEIDHWADDRGVLVKAIEDVALGTASVLRTVELPLGEKLPHVGKDVANRFRDLVARVMPFELVIGEEAVTGERVRLSRSSVCNPHSAIAGTLSFFADRFGVPRAAIEGSNIPLRMIQRYATRGDPEIEFRVSERRSGLVATRRTAYFGFELTSDRTIVADEIPAGLVEAARNVLAQALVDGVTPHRSQGEISRAVAQLDEYWRRSGCTIRSANPGHAIELLRGQLDEVDSWSDFLQANLKLDVSQLLDAERCSSLDMLPNSVAVLGDRIPIAYELEGLKPVAVLMLREGQARRLRERDLPSLDRPLRLSVRRKQREIVRAESVEELHRRLQLLPNKRVRGRPPRRRRRR
jgi:hypothetical protein